MTPEERQLLEGLFERIKTAAPADADKEAEDFIGKSMKDLPHAGYVLSQAVIVQEEALKAAVAKIEELEGNIEELQEKAAQAQKAAGSSFLGGFGKSLFGGDEPASARDRNQDGAGQGDAPFRRGATSVPSTRAPESGISVPPRPGSSAWTHQGAGPNGAGPNGPGGPQADASAGGGNTFLKGALGAAAGVAGGMLLANAVGGLFSGKNNPLGIGGAKAAESKDTESKSKDDDSTSDDDWKDDNSGDDWSENASDTSGDDWGEDSNDDWEDDSDDWGGDGDDS